MVYEVDFLGSGWLVEAAPGFCCDLASVPSWLPGRVWIAEQLARAAIPHDVMRRDRRRSKFVGDWVFFEAMGVDRVPLWLRLIAFAGVLLNFSRD